MTITSTDNPRVKAIAKLKKTRERNRTGLFLIEGHREIQRAIAAGVAIETLVVCPDLRGDETLLVDDLETLTVSVAPMRRMAIRENPPGMIAVARQFDTSLSRLLLQENPLLLIAEHVEKPGNLGAMLRTCDAAGCDALIVADPATDLFNPNVVRASLGALFSVPVAVASARDVIQWCRNQSIGVVGGYPLASREMWDVSMTDATAVLVGAEDVGISEIWEELATPVRIPMAGTADSLNASVSAALLLYEARRQRRTE